MALIAEKGEDAKLNAPPVDLARFLKTLATAWRDGDPRHTHRAPIVLPRHWRTRIDPFEAVNDILRQWLDEAPDMDGITMLRRLQSERPGRYPDNLLRTLQRRVKLWRQEIAHRLVFGEPVADNAYEPREHSSLKNSPGLEK
jgi:hypothetical protein